MADPLNYAIFPYEGNINTGDTLGLKLYLQAKNEIDKESAKLDISVSHSKYVIDHFSSLAHKYGWG